MGAVKYLEMEATGFHYLNLGWQMLDMTPPHLRPQIPLQLEWEFPVQNPPHGQLRPPRTQNVVVLSLHLIAPIP
jgi:hypothetical protein